MSSHLGAHPLISSAFKSEDGASSDGGGSLLLWSETSSAANDEDAKAAASGSLAAPLPPPARRAGSKAARGAGSTSRSSTTTTGSQTRTALASRDAREKRRRAEYQLVLENEALREERLQFLTKIDDLQSRVQEMREREGALDLALENDLLKAQLEEHRLFVGGLMRMAQGVPSTTAEKQRLYRQGADYAVAQIQSLLSRSTRHASEWKSVVIPQSVIDDLGIRPEDIAMSFQIVGDVDSGSSTRGSRRLNLRTDQRLNKVAARSVADAYWRLWTNPSFVLDFLKTFKQLEDLPDMESEVTMIDDALSGVSGGNDDPTGDKEEALATIYTKEIYRHTEARHRFYVASKRISDISRGSLGGPAAVSRPWKRRTCFMCARSSSSSATSENGTHVSNPIVSAPFVEGSITWDEVDDATERPTGHTRQANILSLPESYQLGDLIRSCDDLILEGTQEMSPQLALMLVAFSRLVLRQTKEEESNNNNTTTNNGGREPQQPNRKKAKT